MILQQTIAGNSCHYKEVFYMKFISWNVNGLRACMKKGFMDFFIQSGADVFCVQETKMQPEQAEIKLPGYQQFWNSAEKKAIPEPLYLPAGNRFLFPMIFTILHMQGRGAALRWSFLNSIWLPFIHRILNRNWPALTTGCSGRMPHVPTCRRWMPANQ